MKKGSRKHILAYDNISHERVFFEDLDSKPIGLSFSTIDKLETLDKLDEDAHPAILESKPVLF